MVPYYQLYGDPKTLDQLEIYIRQDHAIFDSLYFAIKAQLLTDLDKIDEAVESYKVAINLGKNETERRHLNQKDMPYAPILRKPY